MVAITTGENALKERISLGLMTLIAARAGCEVIEPKTDYLSVDAIIKPIQGRNLPIDVQVKASSVLARTATHIKFKLTRKNYDDLRSTMIAVPQLLVVVDLHEDEARWLIQNDEVLTFEKSAYWLSLYDWPETTNQTSVTVKIPKNQIMTPDSLRQI